MVFNDDIGIDKKDELSYIFIDELAENANPDSKVSVISVIDKDAFVDGACNLSHPKSYCNIKKHLAEPFLLKKLLDEDSNSEEFETRLAYVKKMLQALNEMAASQINSSLKQRYEVSSYAKILIDTWVKNARLWLAFHKN